MKRVHYKAKFRDKLISGTKKHTIRHWKVEIGEELEHVLYPYSPHREVIMVNHCTDIQSIEINPHWRTVLIEGMPLSDGQIDSLAINDGFDTTEEFWEQFPLNYRGYLIYWT